MAGESLDRHEVETQEALCPVQLGNDLATALAAPLGTVSALDAPWPLCHSTSEGREVTVMSPSKGP